MTESVWVVIPHHSRRDLLSRAIQSVNGLQLLVVDDSPQGGLSCPQAREVLRTEGEEGFARACNTGLERAQALGAEWVLILNDDAALEEGGLESMIQASRNRLDVDAVGPLVRGPKGLESAGLCFSPRTARVVQRRDVPVEPRQVMALSGACLLIRSHWRFSEEFPHAMEDIELGLRIRDAGKKSLLVPEALCWHEGGGTRSRRGPRATRDALRGHLRQVGDQKSKRVFVFVYAAAQVLREGPRRERFGALWEGWRLG